MRDHEYIVVYYINKMSWVTCYNVTLLVCQYVLSLVLTGGDNDGLGPGGDDPAVDLPGHPARLGAPPAGLGPHQTGLRGPR